MADSAPVTSGPVDAPAVAAIDEQPGHKVFAGNLAYTTTDEDLKSFFAPVADDIVSAQVIMRGTRPAGYGFVAFKSAEAAQKAVDLLNKKELDGRTLIVEVAKPIDQKEKEKKEKRASKRRPKKAKSADGSPATNGAVDVAPVTKENGEKPAATEGAPKPKKKRTLRTKVKKAKDAVASAVAGKEGDAPADGATTAPAAVESTKPKKTKTPRAPKPKRPIGEAPAGEPSQTMLFVANLGFNVDDTTLSELFTSAGINVHSARVVRRRWGQPRRSKGYGFVDVGSEDEQRKALELLQGKEVGGREIAVKIAVNSQEKEAREAAQAEENPSLVPAAAA